MELAQYIQLLRKWWWLLTIAASLVGGAAYGITVSRAPSYRADVKVFIGGYLQNPNPGFGDIQTGSNLAVTYANLIKVRPILEATIQKLGLTLSPASLADYITTQTLPNTSILQITVTYPNPVQAADIANELANQLILNSPTASTPEQTNQRNIIENEIISLSDQITSERLELEQINSQLAGVTDPQERSKLEQQRDQLAKEISNSQTAMANLADALTTLGTSINSLKVVEPALVPSTPIPQSGIRNALVAAIVGAAFAFGAALVFEYLDDSFRGVDDLRAVLKVPVLAAIMKFGGTKDSYQKKLITVHAPNSTPVEGYRSLRANLLYGLGDEGKSPTRRIMITSSRTAEGKSITSANLAVVLAKANIPTVLIDTDLHRPQIHNIFGLENRIGLTNLLRLVINPSDGYTAGQIYQALQAIEIPNLRVMTSGPVPPNPAELLSQSRLRKLCESLEETLGTQIILFDTPPVLAVADSLTLASNVKASAVLVVEAGKTRHASAVRVVEQFEQMGINVIGTVLNQITSRNDGYYYYYYDEYGRYKGQNGSGNSNG